MPDRLSALDASFLFAEDRTTAMHVGGVMTFEQPVTGPFDVAAFTALIEERLHLVPLYRQKVRTVPGGWACRCGWTIPSSTSTSTCGTRRWPRRVR